jgi:hypothetical protein
VAAMRAGISTKIRESVIDVRFRSRVKKGRK